MSQANRESIIRRSLRVATIVVAIAAIAQGTGETIAHGFSETIAQGTGEGTGETIAQGKEASKPNFLVILADDLGYSDLGCYGGEIATPHLDGLAAGGLRFSQAYNTARCWPSRAALMTGYYAQQVRRDAIPGVGGGGGNRAKRQPWAKLLPEYLRELGYRNYHSGKWHIDGKVLDGGFDRSLDMRNQGNFFSSAGNAIDDVPVKVDPNESGYYATIATADHAIDCLREHAEKFTDRPFLQYVAFIAPHFPLHALPEDIQRYRDRYLAGWDRLRAERHAKQLELGVHTAKLSPLETEIGPPYHFPEALEKLGPDEINRPLPWDTLTPQQQRFQATKMAIHAAMVDRMDREIGRILEQLRAMQAFDNTLILFASDNGGSAEIMVRDGGHDRSVPLGSAKSYPCLGPGFSSVANTPMRRHKTWVHEGGISTPLIAHWPAGIGAKNQWRRSPVHLIDVAPTIIELAGGTWPTTDAEGKPRPQSPGMSLVPEFAADGSVRHPSLWWLHEGNRAIRVGDWKLVAAKNDPWELYDLAQDRSETTNLAASHPDKVREFETLWQQQLEAFTQDFQQE
jgi:arylsulfatase